MSLPQCLAHALKQRTNGPWDLPPGFPTYSSLQGKLQKNCHSPTLATFFHLCICPKKLHWVTIKCQGPGLGVFCYNPSLRLREGNPITYSQIYLNFIITHCLASLPLTQFRTTTCLALVPSSCNYLTFHYRIIITLIPLGQSITLWLRACALQPGQSGFQFLFFSLPPCDIGQEPSPYYILISSFKKCGDHDFNLKQLL